MSWEHDTSTGSNAVPPPIPPTQLSGAVDAGNAMKSPPNQLRTDVAMIATVADMGRPTRLKYCRRGRIYRHLNYGKLYHHISFTNILSVKLIYSLNS